MRNEETKKRRDEEKSEGDVHGEGKGWRRAIQKWSGGAVREKQRDRKSE